MNIHEYFSAVGLMLILRRS